MGEVHPQANDILEEGGRGNFAECGAHRQFCSEKKKISLFSKERRKRDKKRRHKENSLNSDAFAMLSLTFDLFFPHTSPGLMTHIHTHTHTHPHTHAQIEED